MTNNTMTKEEIKEQIKKITPNKRYAMKQAQNAYIMAKAFNDTNIAIDLEARQEELNAFDYPLADEWQERNMDRAGIDEKNCIRDPKIDYLMADKFTDDYYHAVSNRRIAKGWGCKYRCKDAPEYVVTADADSRPLLRLAEDVLIDCAIDMVPEWMRKDLERAREYPHRQKLIDLAMSWDTNK